jgi:hypothetical protein
VWDASGCFVTNARLTVQFGVTGCPGRIEDVFLVLVQDITHVERA